MSNKVIGFCEETGCKYEVVDKDTYDTKMTEIDDDINTIKNNVKNVTTNVNSRMMCVVKTYAEGYEVYNGVSLKAEQINISGMNKKPTDVVNVAGQLKCTTTMNEEAIYTRYVNFSIPITYFNVDKAELTGSTSLTVPPTTFNCGTERVNFTYASLYIGYPTDEVGVTVGVGATAGTIAYIVIRVTPFKIDGVVKELDSVMLMNLTVTFK